MPLLHSFFMPPGFAELCRSLGSAEELLSELDRGTGNQKPPRKERKKSVTAESILLHLVNQTVLD